MTKPGSPLSYEALFERSPDLLCALDLDGRFLALNAAWERELGHPRDELLGTSIVALVHPEDQARTVRAIKAIMADFSTARSDRARNPFENRMAHRSGSYRKLSWTVAAAPEGVLFASARERAAARSSLRRWKALVDAVPDLIGIASLAQREVLYVNPAGTAQLGQPGEDLRGWKLKDLTPESSAFQFRESILPALEERGFWSGEAERKGPDGIVIPVFRTVMLLPDEDGQPEALAFTGRDLREQRRNEALLRRFEVLANSTSDLVATADLKGIATYVNPAGMAMLGRTGEDPSKLRLGDVVPPAWKERFKREIFPAVFERGLWSGEVEILRADGSTLPVSQVVMLLRDEAGEPLSLATIARDQTEQTLLQQSLDQAIRAMSAPILQVWPGVLAMPIIGAALAMRAPQMTEALLASIVERRARVVILDLTGVAAVDASATEHLVKMAHAASLLGARCLLSGVSPRVAEAIVRLGLPTDHLDAFATLQEALRFAMREA